MRKRHRTALLAVACAATTAAGGGLVTPANAAPPSIGTERDGADTAELSGEEIAEKASKQLNSARSLRLQMKAPDLTLKLALDEKANCAGKIQVPRKGSVQIVKRGGTIWLKPDAAFWKAQLGEEQGAQAADRVRGRYIKGSTQDDELGSKGLANACDLDAFRSASGALDSPGPHWKRGPVTDVDGRKAVPVTRARDDVRVRMLVAADGKPQPLRLDRTADGNEDRITLDRYDRNVPARTPPADRTMTADELRDVFSHMDSTPKESV